MKIKIKPEDLKKVRRPAVPPTKVIKSKKTPVRKPKHPNREVL